MDPPPNTWQDCQDQCCEQSSDGSEHGSSWRQWFRTTCMTSLLMTRLARCVRSGSARSLQCVSGTFSYKQDTWRGEISLTQIPLSLSLFLPEPHGFVGQWDRKKNYYCFRPHLQPFVWVALEALNRILLERNGLKVLGKLSLNCTDCPYWSHSF